MYWRSAAHVDDVEVDAGGFFFFFFFFLFFFFFFFFFFLAHLRRIKPAEIT